MESEGGVEFVGEESCRGKKEKKTEDEISFNTKEKNQLFTIAKNSIRTMLYEDKKIVIDEKSIPEKLKMQMGIHIYIGSQEMMMCKYLNIL